MPTSPDPDQLSCRRLHSWACLLPLPCPPPGQTATCLGVKRPHMPPREQPPVPGNQPPPGVGGRGASSGQVAGGTPGEPTTSGACPCSVGHLSTKQLAVPLPRGPLPKAVQTPGVCTYLLGLDTLPNTHPRKTTQHSDGGTPRPTRLSNSPEAAEPVSSAPSNPIASSCPRDREPWRGGPVRSLLRPHRPAEPGRGASSKPKGFCLG